MNTAEVLAAVAELPLVLEQLNRALLTTNNALREFRAAARDTVIECNAAIDSALELSLVLERQRALEREP